MLKRKWDTNYDRFGSLGWESLTTAAAFLKCGEAWIARSMWRTGEANRFKGIQNDPTDVNMSIMHHASSCHHHHHHHPKSKQRSCGTESQLTCHIFQKTLRWRSASKAQLLSPFTTKRRVQGALLLLQIVLGSFRQPQHVKCTTWHHVRLREILAKGDRKYGTWRKYVPLIFQNSWSDLETDTGPVFFLARG